MAGDHSHSAGMGIVIEERHVVTCARGELYARTGV